MPPHLGDLLASVGPVVSALFAADELERVTVEHVPPRPGDGSPHVLLVVVARGEVLRSHLWTDGQAAEPVEGLQERIASELQDAISESRFGWGELRRFDR